MTEKQRWLMKELDEWRKAQQKLGGQYGPSDVPARKVPAEIRNARKVRAEAAKVIKRWEDVRREAWKKEHDAIAKEYEKVRRVILFESTEKALSAIKGLRQSKGKGKRP